MGQSHACVRPESQRLGSQVPPRLPGGSPAAVPCPRATPGTDVPAESPHVTVLLHFTPSTSAMLPQGFSVATTGP